MERIPTPPRNHWQKAVEQLGFGFHTPDSPYWDESAYYAFRTEEVDLIEKATAELWELCLEAVQHVIDNQLYQKFAIPKGFIPYIEKTWEEDHPAIYGRFDLCYKDGQIKMLEFNADTPTSLFEAGIIQWFWLQDFDKQKDQFNSIHEKLIAYWSYLQSYLHPGNLHFACVRDSLEDLTNTEYLRDCAIQSGIETRLLYIDDIGWDSLNGIFVDRQDQPIKNIFKLYPWEWLINEDFGRHILTDHNAAFWIEPAWKMILSNKAILPTLWELSPDCPWLLPAYFDPGKLADFVRKPILSREGANIEVVQSGKVLQETGGEYGEEGYVYQQLFSLPDFNGKRPVLGSWVIGQEPAGMGIRESDNLVTDNLSRFIPHLIS